MPSPSPADRELQERRRRLRAGSVTVMVTGAAPIEWSAVADPVECRLDCRHEELLGPHFAGYAERMSRRAFSEIPEMTAELVDMGLPLTPLLQYPKRATHEPATIALPTTEPSVAVTPSAADESPSGVADAIPLPQVFPISAAAGKLRDAVLGRLPAPPVAVACVSQRPGSESVGRLVSLAMALAAHTGSEVLLVDANFRSLSLSRLFGQDDVAGLSEGLLEQVNWDQAIRGTAIRGVKLLPAGLALGSRIGRLPEECWAEAVAQWKQRHAYVLVDTMMHPPHTGPLCRACDASFLTLALLDAPRRAAFDTLSQLQDHGVSLTGCIVYEAA